MNNKNNNQMTIGGAIVLKESRGKRKYLLVKQQEDGGWQIPKVTVRKGESSVRAVIRMTSEQCGMNAKILEEAGRGTGSAVINSKTVAQKFYYYLMHLRSDNGEVLGFDDYSWMEYADAQKKLDLKREKDMLKGGRDVLKEWEKTHSLKKQIQEEQEEF